MADLRQVNEGTNIFKKVEVGGFETEKQQEQQNAGTIRQAGNNLPAKIGFWNKFKAFWLQEIDWNKEIKVVLTPNQQKVEDEINEFFHQKVTWEKVHDFLFQELTFRSKE